MSADPTGARDEGFDDFVDAVAADEGYYLECENGHGSVPPRRVCPDCGSSPLSETPLPDAGELETYTVTHVATPAFSEDTPYVTAIASFGPVRITGQLRDAEPEELERGMPVELTTAQSATTGRRLLAFDPR